MRLLGREKLPPLQNESEQTRKWICVWVSEIGHAKWKLPAELLEQYPNALPTAEDTFLFSVCGSNTFLELKVAFAQGIAVITAIVKKL
ncbi:type II toxin-antitoxin system HigB family toxin [Pseudomonas chlororaphis]|uniref:type II toxin-antitoxin system HigB family toxin n=1 Tax=Pseudomonas chlororaphis TaxID=587753 RepID=UPI002368E985|nr:type II toxin-antitoxin system HigB family toxin [Pseudomonas chlororaphis]WDH51186.1 type II toxin-antitoxin system HigB family toxin [Pseudomonas chlororaphis]